MKRLLIVLLLISVFTIGAFAQVTDNLQPTAIPVNPTLAAQGGSFTANASGYNSLFKNPAGFAMDGGDFTLLSVNAWGFVDQSVIDFATNPGGIEGYYTGVAEELAAVTPEDISTWVESTNEEEFVQMLDTAGYDTADLVLTDAASIQAFIDAEGLTALADTIAADPDPIAAISAASPESINLATAVIKDITGGTELLPSGNIRLGTNVGLLGGVGDGFGFGINLNADAYLKGPTIIGAEGYAALTATATAGYALELLPDFLFIGADVRPLYRVYLPVSGEDALALASDFSNIAATMNNYNAYAGWGVGIDAGAIIKLGDLKLGLTVTDILDTQLNFTNTTVGDLMASFSSFSLPEGTVDESQRFVIPMDVLIGAALTLNLTEGIYLDVHGEVSNALRGLRAIQGNENDFDYLSLIHAGANLSLWDFIGIMGGYNEGYLSAGVSLDLFFIEIAATGFMKANAAAVGYSDFGASVEAAIRF